MLPALLGPIAGAAIGGLFGMGGQALANQETAASSAKQMAFQERMSNSQYQRSMADMSKAGLNPILAYKMGGAGTPSGASYTAGNVGSAGVAGAASGLSSAKSARVADYELEIARGSSELIKTQELVAFKQAQKLMEDTKLAKANTARAYADTAILNENLHSARAAAEIARSDEAFYKTEGGQNLRKFNRLVTNLNPFVDSTAKLKR